MRIRMRRQFHGHNRKKQCSTMECALCAKARSTCSWPPDVPFLYFSILSQRGKRILVKHYQEKEKQLWERIRDNVPVEGQDAGAGRGRRTSSFLVYPGTSFLVPITKVPQSESSRKYYEKIQRKAIKQRKEEYLRQEEVRTAEKSPEQDQTEPRKAPEVEADRGTKHPVDDSDAAEKKPHKKVRQGR